MRGDDFGVLARAELQFQGPGRAPRLDLAAEVDPSTVQTAKKFWVVGKMPPATIDWLDNALQEGTVELGRAALGGELADWPFREGQGRFDARARVVQAQVEFNREWPVAEALDLDVAFDGPGMTLDGSGVILGNRVGRVSGGIADFRDPRLRLDIDAAGRGESLQALMLASPLRARYEEHLLNASIRGPATVALELDLPLAARLGGRRIEGSIDLADAALSDPRWGIAFTQVQGRTRFSDRGFATEDLQVRVRRRAGALQPVRRRRLHRQPVAGRARHAGRSLPAAGAAGAASAAALAGRMAGRQQRLAPGARACRRPPRAHRRRRRGWTCSPTWSAPPSPCRRRWARTPPRRGRCRCRRRCRWARARSR